LPLVLVPSVESMRETAAVQALESADLEVNVRYEPLPAYSPNDGRVISQSPIPDVEVDFGITVTIVIGQAEGGPPDSSG